MSSQSLKKEVSLRQLFALSFGSIIGVGWITVMGAWLANAGVMGAALAFCAASLLVVLIAVCYAEMAVRFPATGGEIVYIHEVFGLHAAFVVGWLLAMAYVSVVVFEFVSVGWVVSALFPSLKGPVLYSIGGSDVTLGGLSSGCLGMAVITWFNIKGAKSAATLQEVMALILVIVTVIFCSFAFINGDASNFDPAFVKSAAGPIWPGIISVLVVAPFFFGGFDVVPQAMGEKAETASMKGVPTVLVLSILAAGLFYVAVILAAGIAMPRADLLKAELPMADAISVALGSTLGGKVVLFAGLVGLFTSWNSLTYGAARVLFALGRANIVFPIFGNVDETYKTPAKALLFIAAIGVVGGLFGRSAVLPMVDAGSFAFIFVYAAVSLAAFWHARQRGKETSPAFNVPGGALTRLLTVFLTAAMTVYALYLPYEKAGGIVPIEWVLFGGWIIFGIAFYIFGAKQRNVTSKQERSQLLMTEAS